MTTWESIETAAMLHIKNDLSLEWDLNNRLPVFYNRMAGYMKAAMVQVNRPPETVRKLEENTPPEFTDYKYTFETVQTGNITINTGLLEYEIVSAGILGIDDYETPTYTPVTVASYDSETGDVVINADLNAGDTVELDFYKGGTFEKDLNMTEQGILAFAIYYIWELRFDNNAIERVSKFRDSTFTTISEASQTNAGTSRQKEVGAQLFSMMRAYQDNLEYYTTLHH